LLLQKGANRNIIDNKGRVSYLFSVSSHHTNLLTEPRSFQTPRRVAIKRNNLNTAHLFVSCQAKLEDMVCYFVSRNLEQYGGIDALSKVLPQSLMETLWELNEREKEIREILIKREKSKSENTYRKHDR